MLHAYSAFEKRNASLVGRSYAPCTALFSTLMAVMLELPTETSSYTIVYFGGITNMLLSQTLEDEPEEKRQGPWPSDPESRTNVLLRAMFSFFGNIIGPIAVTLNSIQIYAVILSLSTNFSVFIDCFILGKKQGLAVWICSVTAVLGVIVCIDPAFLGFGKLNLENINIFGIFLTLGFAFKKGCIRAFQANRYLSSSNNLLYNGIGAVASTALMSLMFSTRPTLKGIQADWPFIIGYSLVYYPFQVSNFGSLKLERNTSLVAILFCFNVIFSFIIDIVIMRKPFKLSKLIGSLIVFFSAVITIWSKSRSRKQ